MKLETLSEKIINFSEKINNFQFRPYQHMRAKQLTEQIILNESGIWTSLWARKSGKSETLKALFLAWMALLPELARSSAVIDFPKLKLFRDGLQIAFAGPKMDIARIPFIRLRREARQAHFLKYFSSLELSVITSNSNLFELSNGSLAHAFSGSETAANEGYSAMVLAVDEAQKLSAFSLYKILRPMIAASNGICIETGTPFKKRVPFLYDIDYNKRHDTKYHQEVPYTQVTPYAPEYASFIGAEIDRLPSGVNNPFFRMNYLLEWLIAESHFIEPEFFLSLQEEAPGKIDTGDGRKLYAGIDWGKISSATTCTILENRDDHASVVGLLEVKGSYESQFEYLIPFLQKFSPRIIYSESTGIGDPLTEKLQAQLGKKKVIPRFMSAVYRDQIFTQLKTEMEGQRFRYYMDGSEESKSFERQFLDAEQEVKGQLLHVHKPNEEGAADDWLFSTALALDALLRTPSGKIEYTSIGKKRDMLKTLEDY